LSVFVVLGLIWAAVLLPPILRARAERRAEFIDSFRAQMGALGKKARAEKPAPPVDAAPRAPRVRRPVNPMKRRRDIVGGLLGALMGSLVLGAVPSLRMVWVLHLFLLNLFIGYLAVLAHQRRHLRPRRRARAARLGRAAAAVPMPEPVLAPALRSSR
jgi:predicted lipid-binding transport protein (Tim44 family)